MKKKRWTMAVLVLVLLMGLAALITACGEDEETTTTAAPTTTAGPVTTSPPQTTATTAAPTTTTAKPAQPVELKFSTSVGTKYSLWGAYLEPWYKAVEASSNGLVKITPYPDNTLVKEEQQYDALLDGTSDMSVITFDYNPGAFPVAEVSGLPMIFPNAAAASDVFYDIIQEYCQDEFKDVQVLGVTVLSPAQYAGIKPVKLPADFKGLRMRTGSSVETDVINTLGATPVEIATQDLATSMERKMADGAFLTWSFMFVTGAPDWAQHWTECDIFYRCWVLAMNKDKWESLAPEQQKAFLDNSGKEKSREYNLANDALAAGPRESFMGMAKAPGKSFYTLTAEDRAAWKAAMTPVYKKWADNLPKGIDGQAILARVEELVAKAAPVESTTTTAAAGETGIFFQDLGGGKVKIVIRPAPGQEFEISTEGPFGMKVEAFDAGGKSLGNLEIPEAAAGVLDYSKVAGIAKIVVTDVPHGGKTYEYAVK